MPRKKSKQAKATRAIKGSRARLRPICLACFSFDVESGIEPAPVEIELFTCFGCQNVFYFLPDARPAVRRLALAELYRL